MPTRTLLFTTLLFAAALSSCRAEPAAPQPAPVRSWTAAGSGETGIRSLRGADGVTAVVTKGGQACITTQDGQTPASTFLYFAVTDGPAPPPAPAYVTIEYFDDRPGGLMRLEYDSSTGDEISAKYRPAEDQAGGFCSGAAQWRTAIFVLEHPGFTHRENVGADFRLSGARLFVRAVRLSAIRPAEWNRIEGEKPADVKPEVKIGPGGQLIVGGFDPAHASDARPQARALEGALSGLQLLGVTSHEGYVRWNLCEPSEGHYDWSVYDQFVAVYQRHHLKWVPFLIIGSPYSLPDWYYKKPGSQGYVCLEHGQESDVQSLWNPALRGHVARFIAAFCDHYRSTGVIESILLGVTGNYGEAIYPASGNDWTADIHGQYHTHGGFWAGDPYAVKSFQSWLRKKYGSSDRLAAAWGKPVGDINGIKPFLRKDAPGDRAWLDFTGWYIQSMTDWAAFWLKETRKNFPHGDIYLCTGGHAPPEHGSNFGDQCKAAASVRAGVRITNEGSNYAANFSLTRWVASAGRQYGAYFSFEPAGGVDANGVVARIYNATASGAKGLHYYYPNLFGDDAARSNFLRWGAQFQQRRPIVEIGVYYPETSIKLNGNNFLGALQPLRDRFDFDYISDEQIADGGLTHIKALVMIEGNTAEASAWKAIADWVHHGGLLLYPDGMGRLRTVEGDESLGEQLVGAGGDHGKGRALTFHGSGRSIEYRQFLADTLAVAPELSPLTRTIVAADGKEDGLYVTLCAPRELLWLNYTAQEVHKDLPSPVVLPPYSITSQACP